MFSSCAGDPSTSNIKIKPFEAGWSLSENIFCYHCRDRQNDVKKNCTLMLPINMVTKRSPLVSTIMLKTTSNHSVVLSRFPNVLNRYSGSTLARRNDAKEIVSECSNEVRTYIYIYTWESWAPRRSGRGSSRADCHWWRAGRSTCRPHSRSC